MIQPPKDETIHNGFIETPKNQSQSSEIAHRITTGELPRNVGAEVTLKGWVHHVRSLANVSFVILRDRDGLAQVVVDDPALMAEIGTWHKESVVQVVGKATANKVAPNGVEVHSANISVIAPSVEQPPVEMQRPELKETLPMLLDLAPLSLRHPKRRAPFEISSSALEGFRNVLLSNGFTEITTPKIVQSATESGANVFKIKYFDKEAYLAQSPQFYKQTMVGVFERVFEVAPVFRAEPSDTVRHIAEYVSLDCEIGFIADHTDVMRVVETVIGSMIDSIRDRSAKAVELLGIQLPEIKDNFPELKFWEAQEMIERATGRSTVGEPDLSPDDERFLGAWALKEHGSDFVFVVGYPTVKRPFYTHQMPGHEGFTNSFDVLFKGQELITGGQRLHLYADYVEAIERRGEDISTYESYLQAFKYGMPPHGGFAIGLERFVGGIAGTKNIRESTLFPRDLNRLRP